VDFHHLLLAGLPALTETRPLSRGAAAGGVSKEALLSMRKAFDFIDNIPHPEEAAKQLSRRMHRAATTDRRFPDGRLRRDASDDRETAAPAEDAQS
jgi:hypothetical protein